MDDQNPNLEEQIDRYAAGKLNRKEADALWDELILDPDKLDYLKTSAAVHRYFAKAPASIFSLRMLVSIAAGLALFVVVLNLFKFTEADYVRGRLALTTIPDSGFETLSTLRDGNTIASAEDSMFNEALTLALSGNVERARASFEKLTKDYPVSVSAQKAWLNIGIMLYNQKQFADAATALQQALDGRDAENRFLKEKTYWFLANSYYQQNKFIEARSSAWQAVQLDGLYHEQAIELVRYLDYKLGLVDFKPVKEQ
jgi:tetratricopeptide (TPR) repeat protein